MQTITKQIAFLGADWEVTAKYYPGTNFPIHSASLQPNDEYEIELVAVKPVNFEAPDEFLGELLDKHGDELHEELFDVIRSGD